MGLDPAASGLLYDGVCVPAHPLALDARGRLDEDRQYGLSRYYLNAGAGGLAVGVHTTQFEIRQAGLLAPVLDLAARAVRDCGRRPLLIAGVCGGTAAAVAEAELAAQTGYDLVLVSLAGLPGDDEELVRHVAAVGQVLPVMGFYLQDSVGGRRLGYGFWRALADLDSLVAVKLAPFDRYRTIEAVRAVVDSDRADRIALYTGNDDHILLDLLTVYRFHRPDGQVVSKPVVGSLLGQNAVWTGRAVELFHRARAARTNGSVDLDLLTVASELTDANAAVFDAAGDFQGCIAGINEILYRQGLLASPRLLDPAVSISAAQRAEIDRVLRSHRHLTET